MLLSVAVRILLSTFLCRSIRRVANVYDIKDFLTIVNGSMKNVQTVQLEAADMTQWINGKKQRLQHAWA